MNSHIAGTTRNPKCNYCGREDTEDLGEGFLTYCEEHDVILCADNMICTCTSCEYSDQLFQEAIEEHDRKEYRSYGYDV